MAASTGQKRKRDEPGRAERLIAERIAKLERGLNRAAVESGVRKRAAGQSLTAVERRAVAAYEKFLAERRAWEHYRDIPAIHWRIMSGRQARTVNEQADRYGLPIGGASIDLVSLAEALHDFLATNADALARAELVGTSGDDPLMLGPGTPALERYRDEKAKLARLDRLEREGDLVRRDDVRRTMGRFAALLRQAGETLRRQFGPEAHAVLDEALQEAESDVFASLSKEDAA